MSEHEHARRAFWAAALLDGAKLYNPLETRYSSKFHVEYADALLAEYDAKFSIQENDNDD